MNKEKIKHHLAKLQQNHAELDRKIKEGYSHYIDDEHLQKMKFEKAATKREIVEFEDKLKAQQNEA